MILFIKHIDIEGPETIGSFFEENGYQISVVDLSKGQRLPDIHGQIDAVISLGGPMNVYEEEKYPFLKEDDRFIREVVKKAVPFLGICLGSQLLAKACDAKVIKSPKEERGFLPIALTDEGKGDPLFQGVPEKMQVFQWHGDMFEVPLRGVLLAGAPDCPHQAFRVGKNAYGLQFHIEITEKSIFDWSERYFDLSQKEAKQEMEKMVADYYAEKEAFQSLADLIYNNFLQIVQSKK